MKGSELTALATKPLNEKLKMLQEIGEIEGDEDLTFDQQMIALVSVILRGKSKENGCCLICGCTCRI